MKQQKGPYIVVGVVPGEPMTVVAAAADFAERFDAELVCASVDGARYSLVTDPGGQVIAMPIDSDLGDDIVEEFDAGLQREIASVLDSRPVRWSVQALAGGPAQELTGLANDVEAEMIIVGTRDAGVRGSLHEFFNGSVAAQLAHRQHRPVVVIPLNPVGLDGHVPG